MTTKRMSVPVRFDVNATTYRGPNSSTTKWHGQATIFGRPVADLTELEGKRTKAAAIRALQDKVRSISHWVSIREGA